MAACEFRENLLRNRGRPVRAREFPTVKARARRNAFAMRRVTPIADLAEQVAPLDGVALRSVFYVGIVQENVGTIHFRRHDVG
jgi:hypothetical protein